MVAKQRKVVLEDLESYEERSKRYFEKKISGTTTRRDHVDPMDEDIEDELREIMKNDDKLLMETTDVGEVEDFTVTVSIASTEAKDLSVTVNPESKRISPTPSHDKEDKVEERTLDNDETEEMETSRENEDGGSDSEEEKQGTDGVHSEKENDDSDLKENKRTEDKDSEPEGSHEEDDDE